MKNRLFLSSLCIWSALAGAPAGANEAAKPAPVQREDVEVVELKDITVEADDFDFFIPAPHAAGQRVWTRRVAPPGAGEPMWEARILPQPGRVMRVKALPPATPGAAPRVLFFAADPVGPEPAHPRDVIVGAAKPVVRSLEMKKVAYLGVSTSPVSTQLASHLKLPEGFGLIVDHVEPAGPAEKAGLKAHDVLVKLGDQRLVNAMQLGTLVRANKPGDEIEFTVVREGKEIPVKAKLIEKEVPAISLEGGADLNHFHVRLPEALPGVVATPPIAVAPFPGAAGLRKTIVADRVLRYADDEHQLEIKGQPGGKRELIVTDKAGKEIFRGPIDTDEQRKAVPEAIRPKLEKLEKSATIKYRVITPGRNPVGGEHGDIEIEPGFHGDIELELVAPHDAADLKKLIDEHLKGLKLEGAQQEELKKRIEDMKAKIDEMMKKTRERHGFQGGDVLPGLPAGRFNEEIEINAAASIASFSDGTHQITVKTDEKGKHLTVKDKDGKEIFSGPINTDEERAKVPEEIRTKMKTLESNIRVNRIDLAPSPRSREPQPRPRAEKEDDH